MANVLYKVIGIVILLIEDVHSFLFGYNYEYLQSSDKYYLLVYEAQIINI